MKNSKSVKLLQKAIADELTAVNQYMYFHFHCDDQGYELLSGLFKKVAIEEMMHIEKLAERILFLGEDVDMNPKSIKKILDIEKMLEFAKGEEATAISLYNKSAKESSENEDYATRKIFEELIIDEERHYSLFSDEIDNIKRFGDRYLALQTIERSKKSN